jgi:hypothetical protein
MEQYNITITPAALPSRRGPAPTSGIIAVGDALSWIAFGEARTQSLFDIGMLLRWQHSPLDLFVALSARAGKSPWTDWMEIVGGRFTPLESSIYPIGAERVDVLGGTPVDELVAREWAQTMRALRARARHQEGRPISYAELLDRLTGELAEQQHAIDLLTLAQRALQGALAAGQLTLYARRYQIDRNGTVHVNAEHEAVSTTVFMVADIRTTASGGVQDPDRGTLFVDATLRVAELLQVWSAGDDGLVAARSAKAVPPAPKTDTAPPNEAISPPPGADAAQPSAAVPSPAEVKAPMPGTTHPHRRQRSKQPKITPTEDNFVAWYAKRAKRFKTAPSEAADMKAAKRVFTRGYRDLLRYARESHWGVLRTGPRKKKPSL